MTGIKLEGKFKKGIFNLIILLWVVISVFFIGEVAVRSCAHEQGSMLIPDPIFHHVHNKRFHGLRASPKNEYNVMVKFNSYGFRDYEYKLEKPNDTIRIVILGDSFVDALEVELEETFVKRLENMLNQNSRQGKRYQVLNFGTQGYSTILEYLVLKNKALRFNPDLIITCFHFTDIPEDYTYSQMMVTDKKGWPIRVTPLPLSQKKINFWGKDFLRDHSQLYILARNQYHQLLNKTKFKTKHFSAVYPTALENILQRASSQNVRVNPYEVFKPNYSAEDEQAWGLSCKFLLEVKSLTGASGAKLVILIIPAPDQVAPYEVKEGKKAWLREENSFISSTKMQDRLTGFCRQHGIGVIDILPALRRASLPERPLFFVWDGHFNRAGHKVVADEIYNYLVTNKFFPHYKDDRS